MVCVLDYHLMHSLKAAANKKKLMYTINIIHSHLFSIIPQHEYDFWNFYCIHRMVSEAFS